MSAANEMERLLRRAIRAEIGKVRTSLIGVVESFDAASSTVFARPVNLRRRVDEEGVVEYVREPVIPDVPVVYPGSDLFDITWDLAPGCFVLLCCTERSTDEWQATRGERIQPAVDRRYDLSDAFAIPLNLSTQRRFRSAPGNGDVRIQRADTTITLKANGDVEVTGGGAARAVAIAEDVVSEIQSLRDWAAGHTHTHGSGPGATSAPIAPPPSVGDVSSATLKAD